MGVKYQNYACLCIPIDQGWNITIEEKFTPRALWSLSILCGGAGFQDGGLGDIGPAGQTGTRGWDEALLFLVLAPRVVFPARVQSSVRNHPLNPIPHPQPAHQESPHNFYKFPLYLFPPNGICVYKHRASSWQTATWRFLGCLPQGQAGRACGFCSSGVARTPGGVSSSVKGSWTHRISFFFRIIMTNGFCCLSLSPSPQLLATGLINPHHFSLGLFNFPPSFNPIFSFPVPVWSILPPPSFPPSFLSSYLSFSLPTTPITVSHSLFSSLLRALLFREGNLQWELQAKSLGASKSGASGNWF